MNQYLVILSNGQGHTTKVICQADEAFAIDCVREGVELIITSHNMPCGVESMQPIQTADIPADAQDWGRVEWTCR